jgi:hypothetical protein
MANSRTLSGIFNALIPSVKSMILLVPHRVSHKCRHSSCRHPFTIWSWIRVKWRTESTLVHITFLTDWMPFKQTLNVLSFSNWKIWGRTSSHRRRGLFHSRIDSCWMLGQLAIKSAAISEEPIILISQNSLKNKRNHLLFLSGELCSLSLRTMSKISRCGTWQRRFSLWYETGSFK